MNPANCSMLDLLPIPIVYSSFTSFSPASTTTTNTTRLSMTHSARVLPGGALEYEAKTKRLTFIPETSQATKQMDALFDDNNNNNDDSSEKRNKISSKNLSSSNHSLFPTQLIDPDSLVIRILFCGGFTDGSFEDFGKSGLPFAEPESEEENDQNKMKHFNANASNNQQQNQLQHAVGRSKLEDDLFALVAKQVENKITTTLKTPVSSTTPGLAFVGKIVTAGTNVHFLNEWMPDPGPTSILPRGFKEGDLVCGLQLSRSWLRGEPLRGTLGTYAVVPACFAMRISAQLLTEIFPSNPQQNSATAQLLAQKHQTSLFSSVAAYLLQTTLWNSFLRHHVNPKRNESILFVSIKTIECVKNDDINHRPVIVPASISSLIPAIGATLAALKFKLSSVFVTANCEEDYSLLRKFEESVRMNSRLFLSWNDEVNARHEDEDDDDDIETQQQHLVFDVVKCYNNGNSNNKAAVEQDTYDFTEKFHHVILCDGSSKETITKTNDEETTRSTKIHLGLNSKLKKILTKYLRFKGTIGYLQNRVHHSNDAHDSSSSSPILLHQQILLPIVVAKSGRLAIMSTQTLFDSHYESSRISIVESVALLLSLGIQFPPPTRIIKPSADQQQKIIEPLLRQYKSFLNKTNSNDSVKNEIEWCTFADKLGVLVSDMLQKNIGGLATVLTNRKRQLEDLIRQSSQTVGNDKEAEEEDEDEGENASSFFGGSTIMSMLSDVAFENGLNGLVVQFPGSEF